LRRRLAQIEASVGRYLDQFDSADRQEPSLERTTKIDRLAGKITKLRADMQRLAKLEARMLAAPDQQISLTDPDARSMATSGRAAACLAIISRRRWTPDTT
jgi:transposase